MSEFVEVKTAELVGQALDWCVAQVERKEYISKHITKTTMNLAGQVVAVEHMANYMPSTDWAQGGPIMERENVTIERCQNMSGCAVVGLHDWYATHPKNYGGLIRYTGRGQTVLVASCRAIVAAKLGDVVQVPAELVGVDA